MVLLLLVNIDIVLENINHIKYWFIQNFNYVYSHLKFTEYCLQQEINKLIAVFGFWALKGSSKILKTISIQAWTNTVFGLNQTSFSIKAILFSYLMEIFVFSILNAVCIFANDIPPFIKTS